MTHTQKRTTLAALVVLALVGCGDQSDNVSNDVSSIQGGADTRTTHNYAVGIASRSGVVCSGTLIAPNLVLTARHCVVPSDHQTTVTCKDKFPTTNAPASSLFVSPDADLHSTKNFYAVKSITTPTQTAFCGNDIALIELADNIPAEEAEPAVPVVQFSMTDRKRIGGRITAMGYGITSPAADDSGTRRIREGIEILCVPGDATYPCTDKSTNLLGSDNDKEFVTAGYVCSGDSGGGAFEQSSFQNGKPYLLGALSRGPESKEQCLAGVYSRTDAHAEMIREAAETALEHGGYERPEWLKTEVWEPVATGCVGETCTAVDAVQPANDGHEGAGGCAASSQPTSSPSGLVAAIAGALAVVVRRRRTRR